jgi:hypothetical protein
MRIALVDAFACLANDLLNAGDHRLEVLALAFDRLVVVSAIAAFNAIDQLSHKAAGLADHALSNRQQPAVALDHPLPSLLTPAARSAADLDQTPAGTASAIPKRGSAAGGQLGNPLHGPGEDANPVAEQ